MNCRFCQSLLTLPFIDLAAAPPSNSFLRVEQLNEPEVYYPLKTFVCEQCWLVQIDEYKKCGDIFNEDYAYFSSFSTSWLAHSRTYVEAMAHRFHLNNTSFVVEVASNDGYLLQYFVKRNIPCLGVEPTHGTAMAAREKGVETLEEFWGVETAKTLVSDRGPCDLLLGNNVLAHVPNINDFVQGFPIALKPTGVVTFEFPHLLNLIALNQFDTIYHEHFSYLSLTAVNQIFAANGLLLFDVEELPTHGGSLRVYGQRDDTGLEPISSRVTALLERETEAGMTTASYYSGFQLQADKVKNDFLRFLLDAKAQGKSVIAYGAAAKGNTLLNYAGINSDLLSFVVDRNPVKQEKYMPGSRIPIVDESAIREAIPDYIVILPWNIRQEIVTQLAYVRKWGAHFVTAIPELHVD